MRALLATTIVAVSVVGAQAADHSFWWRTKAEAACLSDVVRLCHSAMPDEDKVTACMETKKQQVSAGCASYYPGGENAD
jgi:hypothetical protein